MIAWAGKVKQIVSRIRCVYLTQMAGREFAASLVRMEGTSPPSAALTCPRCGSKAGVPMNRSDFLIAYSCTACKQRWLVDKDLRAGMSFDDAYGPADIIKVGPVTRS